jgi:hypothetical protein
MCDQSTKTMKMMMMIIYMIKMQRSSAKEIDAIPCSMTRDEGCSKRKFTMSVMYRINNKKSRHILLLEKII